MQHKYLARFAQLLFLLGLLASHASARQEAAARPQSKIVVQVEYFKGAPLAYQRVPGSSWFGRFRTVATPQPRAAADRVLAVDVKTRIEGERVLIKVGVHVGEKHFDRLDVVATYNAAEGETIVARDLERFGVAPFSFKVLRVNETSVAAPLVVNQTQSIEAVISEFSATPLPRAKLTLRNLSSKGVRAVWLVSIVGGRNRSVRTVAERDAKILIEPGATHETVVGDTTTGQSSSADFTPASPESVIVTTVVFDDYSYEGDVKYAATKRAFDDGQRLHLPRLIRLIRDAGATPDVETPEAVRAFREKLSAMGDVAGQSTVDAIWNSYPALAQIERAETRPAVEVSMHGLRRDLLDELSAFQQRNAADPANNRFADWLKDRQGKLEAWLERLSR
jgi:hypothetical protein